MNDDHDLLPPTLDVVFKLMLTGPESEPILNALLNAVLQLPRRIKSSRVLNPEIPKNFADDKGSVLDILVELDDATHVNVEMQARKTDVLLPRAEYYWARTHAARLKRGDDYAHLRQTVSIFLLNYIEFKHLPDVAHHVFLAQHQSFQNQYLPHLRIDFVELPRLSSKLTCELNRPVDERLTIWGRFLRNPNDPMIAEVLMGDNAFKKAKQRLTEISDDPMARELARLREDAEVNYKMAISYAEAKGEAKGKAEGEAKGKTEIARKLLAEPATAALSDELIAKLTELPVDEIRAMRQQDSK